VLFCNINIIDLVIAIIFSLSTQYKELIKKKGANNLQILISFIYSGIIINSLIQNVRLKLGEIYFSNVKTSPVSRRIEKSEYPNYLESDLRIQSGDILSHLMTLASVDILFTNFQFSLRCYDRTMEVIMLGIWQAYNR
jgi:hypothetical protein